MRSGILGGLAAWVGFTMPSAILLVLFAYSAGSIAALPWGAGLLHGLKLVAVAIVAQAVMGMARSLCPDRPRASIAALALVLVLLAPGSLSQIGTIVLGGIAGWFVCRDMIEAVPDDIKMPVSRKVGVACLVTFFVLLALAFLPMQGGAVALFSAFYRSGALVFGGGHVVLPLLQNAVVVPGWVSDNTFLAGYGAAQAVPGPLFTFAAYLGAVASVPPGGVAGAMIALVAIFVPGVLCLLGTLPFWHGLRERPRAQAAMRGTNAAVVGLLGAALYDPVWTSAVQDATDFAIAVSGFVLLIVWGVPPLLVSCICSSRLNDKFAVQDSTNCRICIGTPSCCGANDGSNASEQIGSPLGTESTCNFAVCGCGPQFPLAAIVIRWNLRMLQEGEQVAAHLAVTFSQPFAMAGWWVPAP